MPLSPSALSLKLEGMLNTLKHVVGNKVPTNLFNIAGVFTNTRIRCRLGEGRVVPGRDSKKRVVGFWDSRVRAAGCSGFRGLGFRILGFKGTKWDPKKTKGVNKAKRFPGESKKGRKGLDRDSNRMRENNKNSSQTTATTNSLLKQPSSACWHLPCCKL